ncbi:hypothetical protein E2C01_036800 [Portunus trituberculatus]|uniref:Uncharacterized protein n=1 Tax=Portunus trituberculatus TaxID=210409 RepID=A0A5B7F9N9_PORTR|nr:hypothetical protein [Portunus trituberculatus]
MFNEITTIFDESSCLSMECILPQPEEEINFCDQEASRWWLRALDLYGMPMCKKSEDFRVTQHTTGPPRSPVTASTYTPGPSSSSQ